MLPLRPRARRQGRCRSTAASRSAASSAPCATACTSSSPRPGRAIDHIDRGTLRLDGVRIVVLDEADEMLDMGFADDIESILGADAHRSPDRAVLGDPAAADRRASPGATCATRCASRSSGRPPSTPCPLVTQRAYVVTRAHKPAALGRILDVEAPTAAIVFCRTRTEVDQLTETLNGRGYRAEALHGGMNQEGRDRVMGRLRNGTADLLIATDVAARGLDVDQLTHVINYDVPSAPDAYVHRIGRVGRAGREGVAITLAEPRELRLLGNIERTTGRPIPIEKVPSVADLRARRLEATTGALREALARRRPAPLQRHRRRARRGGRRPRRRPGGDQARPRGPGTRPRRGRDPRVRPPRRSARGDARRPVTPVGASGAAPRPACSSASVARTGCGPAISSGPSPTRPT